MTNPLCTVRERVELSSWDVAGKATKQETWVVIGEYIRCFLAEQVGMVEDTMSRKLYRRLYRIDTKE